MEDFDEQDTIETIVEQGEELIDLARDLFSVDISYMEGYQQIVLGIADLQTTYLARVRDGYVQDDTVYTL